MNRLFNILMFLMVTAGVVLVFALNSLIVVSHIMPVPQVVTTNTYNSSIHTTPLEATQMNAWLQMECISPETCQPSQIAIQSLSVPGVIEDQFNVETYTDISNMEWSAEYAKIGCDDQETGCADYFLPPQNTFNIVKGGAAITVMPRQYIGLLSCNIDKSCDRPVLQSQYTFSLIACHITDNDSLIRIRTGIDFLKSREGGFISGDVGDWMVLEPGDCLVVD